MIKEERIKNAEINSRNKLIKALNNQNLNYELTEMPITHHFDFIININNKKYLIEQKDRNYSIKSEFLEEEGIFLDGYKYIKLIEEYNNYKLPILYTSTFKENNSLILINLLKLPHRQIIEEIRKLNKLKIERIKYLEDLGEEPNEENMKHLETEYCVVKKLPLTYVEGDYENNKIWKVEVKVPFPNEKSKEIYGKNYGKLYTTN